MSDANLFTRGTTWYARLTAPATLQRARAERGQNARADLVRTLSTGDKLEARRRLPAVLASMRSQFTQEERELLSYTPPLCEPSLEELQREAFDLRRSELVSDEIGRAARPTQQDLEAVVEAYRRDFVERPPTNELDKLMRLSSLEVRLDPNREASRREDLVSALRESLQTNNFALIDWASFPAVAGEAATRSVHSKSHDRAVLVMVVCALPERHQSFHAR